MTDLVVHPGLVLIAGGLLLFWLRGTPRAVAPRWHSLLPGMFR